MQADFVRHLTIKSSDLSIFAQNRVICPWYLSKELRIITDYRKGKGKDVGDMRKFYNWVVNHRKLVITLFIIVFIICAICKKFVKVDYDMNDYLPEDSPSTVALDVMDEEFDGGVSNASNLIFGEISFVTNAAGTILQLAVSLDYSVFLIHRFTECRKEKEDVKEAMVDALTMSTSSILSSGLTTVIGFLALCLMHFQIGPDLGRALAKGIAISLITVFTFMPCLILSTYKWINCNTVRLYHLSVDLESLYRK